MSSSNDTGPIGQTGRKIISYIHGVNHLVTGSARPIQLIERLCSFLAGRLDATGASCIVLDDVSAELRLVCAADAYAPDRRGQTYQLAELSMVVQSLFNSSPVSGNDRSKPPTGLEKPVECGLFAGSEEPGGVVCPMVHFQQTVGVFWMGPRATGVPYDEEERTIIQVASGHLAQAVGALWRERELSNTTSRSGSAEAPKLRKLREENQILRKAVDERNHNFSVFAHDLRAPIGVISGHLNILRNLTRLDKTQDKSITAVERQITRLSAMIEELLTRDRRELLTDDSEAVDVGEMAEVWFREFRRSAESAGLELSASVVGNPGEWRLDHGKLYDTLSRLMDNAIKHSVGAGEIELELSVSPDEKLQVALSTTSTGDLILKDEAGGRPSLRTLVELQGGQLVVADRDSGCDIQILIPGSREGRDRNTTAPADRQVLRVLVIEPDRRDLYVAVEALSARFEVVTARSEREATWLLQQVNIDCAVIDLNVPLMTGFTIAAELRKDPGRQQLPVLFTADADPTGIAMRKRNTSLEAILQKPVDPDQLLVAVSQLIETAEQRKRMSESMTKDTLSGLLTRRNAERELDRQVSSCLEKGNHVSVLVVDIDRFEEINANFGRDVGDDLIRDVAHTLSHSVRISEFVARWGGDEFVVILPNTNASAAKVVAQRILERCSRASSGSATATVSIGYATGDPRLPIEAQALVARAEEAVEHTKMSGGNAITAWPIPVATKATMSAIGAAKRLLIVDDDRAVLRALARYFGQATNMEVVTCKSGREAMKIATRRAPDVVILDLKLAGTSGFDLLKELREATRPDLPAIAYTGHSNPSIMIDAEDAGFNACFTKSALLDHLVQEVARWVE
ncbi:MAG: diguanylate cyclase [Myxococcales bacterium]|nr:diguanylate cyclase [Myxococcales bacterium]